MARALAINFISTKRRGKTNHQPYWKARGRAINLVSLIGLTQTLIHRPGIRPNKIGFNELARLAETFILPNREAHRDGMLEGQRRMGRGLVGTQLVPKALNSILVSATDPERAE